MIAIVVRCAAPADAGVCFIWIVRAEVSFFGQVACVITDHDIEDIRDSAPADAGIGFCGVERTEILWFFLWIVIFLAGAEQEAGDKKAAKGAFSHHVRNRKSAGVSALPIARVKARRILREA